MKTSSFTEMNSIDYYNNQNRSVTNTENEMFSFIVTDYQDIIIEKIKAFFSKNKPIKNYNEIEGIDSFLIFLIKYRSYIQESNREDIIFKSLSWNYKLRLVFLKEIYYLAKIDIRYDDKEYIFSLTNKDIFLDKCNEEFQEYLKKRSKDLLLQRTFKIKTI